MIYLECKKIQDKIIQEKIPQTSIVPSPILLAGSIIVSGAGKYIVLNVGINSAIGTVISIIDI